MSRNTLTYIDRYLNQLSRHKLRAHWANGPLVLITQSGTKGAIWIVMIVLLLLFGGAHARAAALASLCSLLVAEGVMNVALKPSIARERLYAPRGPGRLRQLLVKALGGHSSPSAHVGSAIAAAVPFAISYTGAGAVLLVLAALIGYSRVYVGVHFPSDVVASAIIGDVCAGPVLACAFDLAHDGMRTGFILSAVSLR